MSGPDVRLRRTWPQRLIILVNSVLIVLCVVIAVTIREAEQTVAEIPRVSIDPSILVSDVPPGDPVTFLLVGIDSAAGLEEGDARQAGRDIEQEAAGQVRADSIILLRVDPATGQAAMVSLPRDLWVDIPGTGTESRINAALTLGGREKLVETISENFDVEINHYVQVDFAGFADVINEMGGVHVWFDHPARDDGSFLDIPEAGCQLLDGDTALAYVRGRQYQEFIDGAWRYTGGNDLARISRQQDFLIIALDEARKVSGRNPVEIKRMIDAGVQSVVLDTELTASDLLDLANAMGDFDPERLQQLSLSVYDDVVNGAQILRLYEDQAESVFDVIRGEAGFLDPDDVTVLVGGGDTERVAEARAALTTVGFVVEPGTGEPGTETVIRFGRERADEAELLGRFLTVVPRFEVVEDAQSLTIVVADDFDSVRQIARAEADVEPDVLAALDEARPPAPSSTTTPDGEVATPETTVPEATTTTELITGRPPEGQSCP